MFRLPTIAVPRSPVFIWIAAGLAVVAPLIWWSSKAAGAGDSIGLRAEPQGEAVRVTWNRTVRAIERASGGEMLIHDGAREHRLKFDPHELRTGSLQFWPENPNVEFQLEISDGRRRTVESARVVAQPGRPALAPVVAVDRDPGIVQNVPPETSREKPPDASRDASAVDESRAPPKPAPVTSAARIPPSPPVRGPIRDTLHSSVELEPVRTSGIKRAIGRVPGLNRLGRHGKEGASFVPAKALHRVSPVLAKGVQSRVAADSSVRLKVLIGKDGIVERADVLTKETDSGLIAAALGAITRWDFEPARMNNQPVSSEMLVNFRFSRTP